MKTIVYELLKNGFELINDTLEEMNTTGKWSNKMFEIKKVAWLDQDQRAAVISALVKKQQTLEVENG